MVNCYIKRMKAIANVISNDPNYLDIQICQIVRLIKNNEFLKMSKREGNIITLNEIFNEVGKDPLRYYMTSTKSETPMDFDMNKVIEKNKDNPVFYCQYAYARASSVILKANSIFKLKKIHHSFDKFDYSHLSDDENEIIIKLLSWPFLLNQTCQFRQPHRITNYIEDISSNFHSFWNKGKENESLRLIDENNLEKTITKLIWINSFKIVLKKSFNIIGIDAPETM